MVKRQIASRQRITRAVQTADADAIRLSPQEIWQRGYANIAVAHGFKKDSREYNAYCDRIRANLSKLTTAAQPDDEPDEKNAS